MTKWILKLAPLGQVLAGVFTALLMLTVLMMAAVALWRDRPRTDVRNGSQADVAASPNERLLLVSDERLLDGCKWRKADVCNADELLHERVRPRLLLDLCSFGKR